MKPVVNNLLKLLFGLLFIAGVYLSYKENVPMVNTFTHGDDASALTRYTDSFWNQAFAMFYSFVYTLMVLSPIWLVFVALIVMTGTACKPSGRRPLRKA
jgi:hypothetical protein